MELSTSDCKNDTLHDIGKIQPHGALIAFNNATMRADYCSANVTEILGISPTEILGKTGEQCFGTHWLELNDLYSQRDVRRLTSDTLHHPLDITAHEQGNYYVYEFEPSDAASSHWWDFSERMLFLKELSATHTTSDCQSLIVKWLFERTGFDRVLYYHFLPDLHGVVVAERCRPGVDSFLGLHFPASDIPPNAHALYTKNLQRIIVDVTACDVQVISRVNEAPPLDLGSSMLRSVHPVHIQYLRNMGVSASFSVSIIVNEKLHALVACHHMSPSILHMNDRLAFEEIGRMASFHLESLLEIQSRDNLAHFRQQISHIEGALSTAPMDVSLGLSRHLHLIQQLLGSSSAWLHYNNTDHVSGINPGKQELHALGQWLGSFSNDDVSTCHCLPHHLAQYPELSTLACGILYIPFTPDDYVVLFRPEIVKDIPWAGKPTASESGEDSASPLTPRSSFKQWVQQTRSTATPWNEVELDFARELRADIMNYINRAHLEKTALYDGLTGLANRQQFEQKLKEAISECQNKGRVFAVHMADLDHFKPVNDNLGHAAGDQLLQEVANRLLSLLRQSDTVARFGGDEFAIIQTGLVSETGADILAEKIVQRIAEPYKIDDAVVNIGISVGTALCPVNSTDAADLLHQADMALYTSKRNGRNQYHRHKAGTKRHESSKKPG